MRGFGALPVGRGKDQEHCETSHNGDDSGPLSGMQRLTGSNRDQHQREHERGRHERLDHDQGAVTKRPDLQHQTRDTGHDADQPERSTGQPDEQADLQRMVVVHLGGGSLLQGDRRAKGQGGTERKEEDHPTAPEWCSRAALVKRQLWSIA